MSLPDNIYVEIFSYLSKKELVRTSMVSKKWHCLCFDPYLWKEISIDDFSSSIYMTDETVCNLVRFGGRSIKSLVLRGCYQITNRVLKELAVTINGSSLQSLSLENCFRVTDRGIITLARSCSTLRTINVMNTLVTENGLSYLVRESPKLVELIATPSAVSERTVEMLSKHCKQLEYLHVEQNEFAPSPACSAKQSSQNNKVVANNKTPTLTNRMMEMLASNCHQLQVLILRYPLTAIDDYAMHHLGQHCQKIECVEIGLQMVHTAVTDTGVISLCANSSNLLRLDLRETLITDMSLCFIAEHCESLEHLSFDDTGPVTDIGVLNIMKKCHNLDSFCLRSGAYSRLTDLGVFAVAQSACSLNLIKLSLKFWNITDFGLYVLAKHLPNLMYLSVEGCIQLTNQGLREALKRFKSLHSLDLTHTKCVVSDEELVELAELLPQTFQSVFLKAKDTSVDGLSGCITEKGCEKFSEILPDCELVFVPFR